MEDTETLSEDQKQANVVRLAFGGDQDAISKQFCEIVREAVPEADAGVLRGSAITGCRWKDGAPFDADGPARATWI